MANTHATLAALFDGIAGSIRAVSPVTEEIKADAFPAYIKMLGYDGAIPAAPSVLDSCPWDFIRWASDEGIADLLWSVGDRKAVTLGAWGGPWTSYQVSAGTYYVYIIGFNHNKELEGDKRIHFEFGFTQLSDGTHIAFSNGAYNLYVNDSSQSTLTRMNKSRTNVGGWKSCTMRTGTLNGEDKSLLSASPSDLVAALKTVTKYTDNAGGGSGSVESNVTSTVDTYFLLNVHELRGTGSMNTYEAQKTAQYQYYKNGNEQGRNKSNDTSVDAKFLLRSPNPSSSTQFMGFGSGVGLYVNANMCLAISPAFCV